MTIVKEFFFRNRQFILYCIIGGSGVTLDFSVYSLSLRSPAIGYQTANALGYASGTLLSFFLNAHYNFKTRDRLSLRLAVFCTVAALGWLVSAGTLYVLVMRTGIDKYVAKVITLAVVVILQYNLNRLISFRKSA